jgi:hypothetical protein
MYYPIVVLSHCCSSANVIEPREPHTCNNIDFGAFSTSEMIFLSKVCSFIKKCFNKSLQSSNDNRQ